MMHKEIPALRAEESMHMAGVISFGAATKKGRDLLWETWETIQNETRRIKAESMRSQLTRLGQMFAANDIPFELARIGRIRIRIPKRKKAA